MLFANIFQLGSTKWSDVKENDILSINYNESEWCALSENLLIFAKWCFNMWNLSFISKVPLASVTQIRKRTLNAYVNERMTGKYVIR